MEIIGKLQGLFAEKGIRLSVAESCTGGLIGHLITNMPGSSAFFHSSIVCYSPEAKTKLLGVRKSFLKKHGTVSEETARAMAEAVRKKTGADISIAVTGVTGPASVEGAGVGLVFVAVSSMAETTSRGYKFEGTRQEIKDAAAERALKFLFEAVSAWGA